MTISGSNNVSNTTNLLPFQAKRPMINAHEVIGELPWSSPAFFGLTGIASDGRREPLLLIGYEWPAPWSSVLTPIPKDELERNHLDRFNNDHVIAKRSAAFSYVSAGGDPPDFIVRVGQRNVHVDCAALTVPSRRAAHGLFTALRRHLMGQDRARFAHLNRHVIYIWFPTGDGGFDVPYRRNDQNAHEELTEALANYHPNIQGLRGRGTTVPEHLDTGEVATPSGATFYAVPMQTGLPTSTFFTRLGFELGLAYTTTHTPDDSWDEVERLIAVHDKPQIDWLLLSAGAPNREGYLYFTEEVLADFLLEHRRVVRRPTHIERVILHWWTRGRAVELIPDHKPLFGPLYEGIVLAHEKMPGAYATRLVRDFNSSLKSFP